MPEVQEISTQSKKANENNATQLNVQNMWTLERGNYCLDLCLDTINISPSLSTRSLEGYPRAD
jgi:hypothetical protein